VYYWRMMIRFSIVVASVYIVLASLGSAALAGAPAKVHARTVLSTDVTASGQKLAYPTNGAAQATMLYVEIPPHSQTGWHVHPVPGFAYVLTGVLTVKTHHGAHVYSAGHGFAEVVNTPHNGTNLGNVPVKLVVVYTGVRDEAITRKAQ
jgi:quercetin dioxygenase-like cupin family protein